MELRTILYVNASHLYGLYFLSIAIKKLKAILIILFLFFIAKKHIVHVYDFDMNSYLVKNLEIFRGRNHE